MFRISVHTMWNMFFHPWRNIPVKVGGIRTSLSYAMQLEELSKLNLLLAGVQFCKIWRPTCVMLPLLNSCNFIFSAKHHFLKGSSIFIFCNAVQLRILRFVFRSCCQLSIAVIWDFCKINLFLFFEKQFNCHLLKCNSIEDF